jgi:hypothetical protein
MILAPGIYEVFIITRTLKKHHRDANARSD